MQPHFQDSWLTLLEMHFSYNSEVHIFLYKLLTTFLGHSKHEP